MIDTGGLAALVQRGAASARRREMIEVAYDKRIGDETRPLKRNYFLPQGFIIYFFVSVFLLRLKKKKQSSNGAGPRGVSRISNLVLYF